MAAVDKIYGTKKEYLELKAWLEVNNPELLMRLYHHFWKDECDDNKIKAISNFSTEADIWLLKNSPFDWVKERINGTMYDKSVENIDKIILG